MSYCCDKMKKADEDGWIDYCPPHSVDLEIRIGKEDWAIPIDYCPFCGVPLNAYGTRVAIQDFLIDKEKSAGSVTAKE